MTAKDFVRDRTFRAFCEAWRIEERCPLPLSDWLRERGLDGQAAGAFWAHHRKMLRPPKSLTFQDMGDGWGFYIGPLKWVNNTYGFWRYSYFDALHAGDNFLGPAEHSCDLDDKVFEHLLDRGTGSPNSNHNRYTTRTKTFPRCIANLLDAYAAAYGDSQPEEPACREATSGSP